MKYIVLMEISPDQGPLIRPAAEGEDPTIIEESELFASPSDLTNEERARLLINRGVIVPIDAKPEQVEEAKIALKQTQAEATRSLRTIAKE